MLAWRIPRIARFVCFFLCASDVMAACTCVRSPAGGVIPCRMVPSVWDEVHGSCMTSRAESSMCGCACRAKMHEVRVAALEMRIQNFKRINSERKSKPRFRVNMISRGRGEIPPVSWAQDIPLVRGWVSGSRPTSWGRG